MLDKKQQQQIVERARTSITRVTLSLISGVINGFFLIIWAVMQWAVSLAISSLQLTGITAVRPTIFQVSFAIATATPILINIYADIRVAIIQARKRIQREEELSEQPDSKNDRVVFAKQNQDQIQSQSRLSGQLAEKGGTVEVTRITKEGTHASGLGETAPRKEPTERTVPKAEPTEGTVPKAESPEASAPKAELTEGSDE